MIKQGGYGDIDSLLVLRNNHLVFEEYFSPQYRGRDYRVSVRSVTKSIASALIGIAIDQGKIDGVDANLLDYFAEYTDIKNLDARKKQIKLKQVLEMTAGFEWDELSVDYGDPIHNSARKMTISKDWLKHVLDLPMRHAPGEVLEYNSGCSYLLSSILQKSTGLSAEEFARRQLFEPLGIEKWSWSLAATNGLTNTAWGLSLTRRDMARFGLLYLNQGRWQGRQLVPREWVKASTREHASGSKNSLYAGFAYGYQWWRLQDHEPTIGELVLNDIYFAYGNGGQLIFVIPHLDMVVVSTGELHGDAWSKSFDLLRDYIFPALLD